MFSSQSFSSASVTGRQGYQGIRRVSRTKCVPVKIVCGADVSAATPFLSFTEYLLTEHLKSLPYPHFEPAPVGLLVRIDANGNRTTGRFVNRKFQSARSSKK